MATLPTVKALEKWLRQAVDGEPTMYLLWSEDIEGDAIHHFVNALRLGHALIHGKQVILFVPHGTKLPPPVRRLADRIERYDPDDRASSDAAARRALVAGGIPARQKRARVRPRQ